MIGPQVRGDVSLRLVSQVKTLGSAGSVGASIEPGVRLSSAHVEVEVAERAPEVREHSARCDMYGENGCDGEAIVLVATPTECLRESLLRELEGEMRGHVSFLSRI